ncbi:major capsid protein, partial [Salmonella enterica subsp. enterica serovar Newport]|nr:major capsid protein [Salmonella enterica subsp. enterica serovar Newport]EHW6509099.1 major capsid protein [Salmonella enterica]
MNFTPEAQKLVNRYISELKKTFSDCERSSDRYFSLTEPRSIALRKALLEST